MRVRGVGGRWCWAEVRARVTARDAGGLPLRVAGTFADVTDRIAAQDAAADVAARNAALVVELQSALAQVKTLRGLIPICMHCHKIRDAEGAWERLEVYLTEQTDARLSHGLCPECAVRYYPVD